MEARGVLLQKEKEEKNLGEGRQLGKVVGS